MDKVKAYISGPMSGVKDFNYPAFRTATERLRSLGWDITSPHEIDAEQGKPGDKWADYLYRDMKILTEDPDMKVIVFLIGWQRSNGARVEALVGLLNGFEFFQFEDGYVRSLNRRVVANEICGSVV
jgi:hypothetical protein